MNRRERILALTALAVVILAGGGFLFKFLFLDALASLNAQIAAAEHDIQTKNADLAKEAQDEKAVKESDPRLGSWQKLSLPADKNLKQEIKKGISPEEAEKHHEDLLQGEYEGFLHDLVARDGFAPNSIKISSAPADRKGAPNLTGKTPAYTRMSFTVQGQAGLDAVARALEDFYRTPLLHEVRNLTLSVRQQTRPTAPGAFAPPGPPGSSPVAAAPGFPSAVPGGFVPSSAITAGSGDLDVSMTVEALLVTGAEERDSLLPDGAAAQVHTLAFDPDSSKGRTYSDMLAKNMFTGVPAKTTLTEDKDQVLSAVRLTSIWNNGRRWQATIYDQGKGGDEKRIKLPVLDEFDITDKYGNDVVKAKVVKLDEDGLVFLADGKYYLWRCGEYLGKRPKKPGSRSAADDDSNPYIPGVMDTPLTGDQVKALSLASN